MERGREVREVERGQRNNEIRESTCKKEERENTCKQICTCTNKEKEMVTNREVERDPQAIYTYILTILDSATRCLGTVRVTSKVAL